MKNCPGTGSRQKYILLSNKDLKDQDYVSKLMKRLLAALLFLNQAALAVDELWIKVGYGVIVLVALFVLYKLIKTTEEEEVQETAEKLPWNEMRSITRKAGRLRKKKTAVDEAFDKAKIIKWSEGEKVYD